MEEVTEGLNNMCAVIGDLLHPPWRGWPNMVVPGIVMKNLVMGLDLGQPRVVLGEGLKDIHGERYRGDLCGHVCTNTIAHG